MQDVIRETRSRNGITFVEFTLLPAHAQGLEAGFLPGIRRGIDLPDVVLKGVVDNHLPPSMLEELRDMPKSGAPRVYIIHGAPEISREEFLAQCAAIEAAPSGNKPLHRTIADRMTRGVQLNMDHKSTGNNPMYVRKNNKATVGRTNEPHKDGSMVSGFSMIINDQQAPTRFTDWRGLLDEAKRDPTLGNILVRYGSKDGVRLADFDNEFRGWEDKLAGVIMFSAKNPTGSEAMLRYELAYAKHSEDVVLKPGDIALWTNKGMMLHSARDGNVICPEGVISRAAVLNLAHPNRT
ncbi:MAG: hypothetical protein EBV03_05085 [Proteobacteria bacterium]|nr:hypothetical protein [Pseudomonadota bacterium]